MALSEILAEYERQRARNREALNERREEIFKQVPEIRTGREEMRTIAMTMAKHAIEGGLAAIEYGKFAQARMLEIRGREQALLKKHGLPEDALELRFHCETCKDTGYVGEMRRTQCHCLKQKLAWEAYSRYGARPRSEARFENFDLSLFPDMSLGRNMLSQREVMRHLQEKALQYVQDYPGNEKCNMLLIGGTGMGKTYLLNCIAHGLMDKEVTVLKLTAFTLFEELLEDHRSMGEKQALKDFLNVPILMIDDLGTEPLINNVTVEYLFSILNERIAARRHTLTATNLMPAELTERYGERIASRLLDNSCTLRTILRGKDVRLGEKARTQGTPAGPPPEEGAQSAD